MDGKSKIADIVGLVFNKGSYTNIDNRFFFANCKNGNHVIQVFVDLLLVQYISRLFTDLSISGLLDFGANPLSGTVPEFSV